MKALIIYAHPKTKGHNPYVLQQVEKKLQQKKISYKVIDLYKDKFDPVMHEKEHYTVNKLKTSPQVKKYQKLMFEADHWFVIYPIWWGSMPAILKGFFDKTLTPNFAFKFEKGRPIKLMTDKSATVIFTTGAPAFLYWTLARTPIRHIKTFILGFCGLKTKVYIMGRSMNKFDAKRKPVINAVIEKIFKNF